MISATHYLVSRHHSHVKALNWVQAQNGDVPSGAVEVGRYGGRGGEFMYIGRVTLSNGDTIPGTVIPGRNTCFVAWNGHQIGASSYEVLVNSHPLNAHLHWVVPTSDGHVPNDAVRGGVDASSEMPIFIARARPPGVHGTHAGGIRQGDLACPIAYDGSVHVIDDYKILCKKVVPENSLLSPSHSNRNPHIAGLGNSPYSSSF